MSSGTAQLNALFRTVTALAHLNGDEHILLSIPCMYLSPAPRHSSENHQESLPPCLVGFSNEEGELSGVGRTCLQTQAWRITGHDWNNQEPSQTHGSLLHKSLL